MKISISPTGSLWIERAGMPRGQFCRSSSSGAMCGDDCPHFGEPREDAGEQTHAFVRGAEGKVYTGYALDICRGTVLTGEIVDQRGSGGGAGSFNHLTSDGSTSQ
jgi:hypothetical protein